MRRIKSVRKLSEVMDGLAGLGDEDADSLYMPVEKNKELRYTLGPVYSPNVLDAHNEFTDSDELRKAIWELNEGDRQLRLQHGDKKVGVIKELFCWPNDHTVDLKLPDGTITKSVTFPAGTAYAGVQWNEEAWADVKAGRLRGYSMGGKAVRIRDADATGLSKLQ